jgi:hypothetical protein
MLSTIHHAASYLKHLQAGGQLRLYVSHGFDFGGFTQLPYLPPLPGHAGFFGSLVPPVTGPLSTSGLAAPLPVI